MNMTEMFISFIFALIIKDFYDIFMQSHIQLWLSKYKILVTSKKKRIRFELENLMCLK